jgi:hypothetical protein
MKNNFTNEYLNCRHWTEEENNLWKGWTYSSKKNRYYFDDLGNESFADFWADEFLNQAYN